jgi:hypothetical protein
MYIRPYPVDSVQDSYASHVGNEINNQRLKAGKGIRLTQHGGNTVIENTNTRLQEGMVYRGVYDFNEQYFPNDVVYVDKNKTYIDQNNQTMSFASSGSQGLSPGTFICLYYVGPAWQTKDYLISSIYPVYTAQDGIVTDDMSDHYRHYDCNIYYPTSNPITGITRKTEVSWTTVVSQSFWAPLGGIGAGGGFNWQTPYKELNPSQSVAIDTWVYVSPNSNLATAGIIDADSGDNVTVIPGIWAALKTVPVQTVSASVIIYHAPKIATVGSVTDTSGSLRGDFDNSSLYWALIHKTTPCS